jgi:uncharacterized UPF0160 family protein
MNTVTIVTHNGRFHADDVFAVATLYLFLEHSDFPAWRNKAIKIIRTRDEELFKEGNFVVDVGGIYDEENNLFDHHQSGGAGKRANGIPYASFGLVWKKYGEHVASSKTAADMIDVKLVQSIDANDNGFPITQSMTEGVELYLFDDFIFSFYPTWKESADTFDATFHDLVELAQALLKREIKNARAKEEAAAIINAAYAISTDKKIIVLDRYLPWKDILMHYPEPLFVIYPVPEDSKWHVSAVPQKPGRSFENRKNFPAAWAGKRDQELAKISGVPDAIFCHNKLFLAVAGSKDGALELATKALTQSPM